jgi:hypothetical protein
LDDRKLRRHEQAIIHLREAAARNPASLAVHVFLAAALKLSGQQEEADWQSEEIRSIKADFTVSRMLETYPLIDDEQREKPVSALQTRSL